MTVGPLTHRTSASTVEASTRTAGTRSSGAVTPGRRAVRGHRPGVRAPRRLPLVALAAVVVALAAGCGSSGGSTGTSTGGSTPRANATSAAFEPVTIEHRYGSTTIDKRPERIVSLDVQWTDTLIALGEKPVAYIDYSRKGQNFPWDAAGLKGATMLHATTSLPFEQIAAQKPDLIVVTYFAQDKDDYDKLSEIAPTIPLVSKDRQVDTWQQIAATAGKVLGEPTAASRLVDTVDAQVAAVAAELPGLKGKTFVLAQYVPGKNFVAVSDPTDGSVVLFDQLGMKLYGPLEKAGSGVSGRADISFERIDLLDADFLMFSDYGADPHGVPGYDDLAVVRAGATAVVDMTDATAVNTPTPLSVPYALKILRPALEAAAKR